MGYFDYKNVYIGKLIQEKVDENHMSYAEFARLIHCGRTNVYRIFECKSIDIERLLLISEVLHYDFIHEVYMPHFMEVRPNISGVILPFKNGHVSLEGLPEQLREQIKGQL